MAPVASTDWPKAHTAYPAAARHRASMSATSYDAVHGRAIHRLKIGASELDAPDPTQDIADEVTSELGGAGASVVDAPPEVVQTSAVSESIRRETPAAGTVLRDRYVLEALLGSGGTAVVFRASDLRRDSEAVGGHPVAVKLLRPERRDEARSIARLQREFRQTQTAAHPNVVRFHDLDCDHGSWFITMELLSGETLAAQLRRADSLTLSVQQATAIAGDVADALAHAHAVGVVHGDVKPANIFMTDTGGIRLLDFGVAPDPHGPPEPTAGTRAYASPEVLGGERAEAGDDVFSLACVTCEMISGLHPYGRGGADAAARAGAMPLRPAGLDDKLWQVLVRALDFSRPARPGMKEFALALRGAPASVESAPAPAPAAAAADPAVPAVPLLAAVPTVPAIAAMRADPIVAPPVNLAIPIRRSRLVTAGALAAGLMLVLGILIGRLDPGAKLDPPVPAAVTLARSTEASMAPGPSPVPVPQSGSPTGRPQVNEESAPIEPQTRPSASAGLVTFDLPTMMVSNRAVVAAIPLRHLSARPRDVRVNWRIIEGSARPGRDYGGPESGVESFVAGNNFRILYVPIVANPASPRDRTFVVELTGATPGVEVGGAPRIAVTILGDG
jgi:serine/threonine protein kinase